MHEEDEKKPPEVQMVQESTKEEHGVVDPQLALAIRMYRDWIVGMTFRDIGAKYGVPKDKVARMSRKYKWEELRNTLAARAFSRAMTSMVKTTTALMSALDEDFNNMNERRKERKHKTFTTNERAHIRHMAGMFLKEKRLEEGTPTDLPSNQPPAVTIVLPPGVQNFGLIPTPANAALKTIESTAEEKPKEEPSISIEDVEDTDGEVEGQ